MTSFDLFLLLKQIIALNFTAFLTCLTLSQVASAKAFVDANKCLLPNYAALLTAPLDLNIDIGFTYGASKTNPTKSCQGLMLDADFSYRYTGISAGWRTFQRYDWPSSLHLTAGYKYANQAIKSGVSRHCLSMEGGYGVLMTSLRLGVVRCEGRTDPYLQFGVAY